jgi:hypothetical protein
MPNSRSKQVAGAKAAASALDNSALIQVVGEYLTKTGDVINDVVEMGAIPAGCIPVDVVIDNGALGASATLDVGILSGNYGDNVIGRTMLNAEFIAAGAAATAGVLRRNRVVTAIPVQLTDRSWGVRFLGANPAAGQLIRGVLTCAPNPTGVAVA